MNQTEQLEHRTAHLRRAFARGLGRRPSVLEEAALSRAARLTARSEIAARDPDVDLLSLVRIDNAAARARAHMANLLAAKRKPEMSLQDYARQKQAAAC